MAAATLAIVPGSVGNRQADFNRIAQANQPITQPVGVVESLDTAPQVAQFMDGARKTVPTTVQANVMPHDVLYGLHIALDQCRVALGGQAGFIPTGYLLDGRDIGLASVAVLGSILTLASFSICIDIKSG